MGKLWETEAGGTGAADPSGKMQSPWQKDVAGQVEAFTVGNDYRLDLHLLPYDLKASAVHVEALRKAGLLTKEEAEKLGKGLEEIRGLWEKGAFEILREHEDGHTAIEVWLTRQLGDLGKKIHTGRSRNDQVLTAVRLYERDQLQQTLRAAARCAETLLEAAEEHQEWPMPGYTHTRKAMLSSVGQWLGGYAELLVMQLEASSGVRSLAGRSPLGTAAGFGTSLDLDRDGESEAMGFDQPMVCATAAQLSRGWVELQLVDYLSGLTAVLARLAGDIIQFSSEAYGFIEIESVLCTGSSIMPNKRNPDVAELIRGNHSRMEGHAATLRRLTAPLGSGYHRDLQLTKEPVIEAFRTAGDLIGMSDLLVRGLRFNRENLIGACSSDLMAAEEAYKRVKEEGITFRDAYREVKKTLEAAKKEASGAAISGAGDHGTEAATPMGLDNPEHFLRQYRQLGSPGNPGIDRLKKQVAAFVDRL